LGGPPIPMVIVADNMLLVWSYGFMDILDFLSL
jgi:hypothetical protein